MQFSSISTLIDVHMKSQLQKVPFVGASIFLNVTQQLPLILEDSTKTQLMQSENAMQAYLQCCSLLSEGVSVCLQDVEVKIKHGMGYCIQQIQVFSKSVIAGVGEKEKKLQNVELRMLLQKSNGKYPLAISTLNYIRRMEQQQVLEKHYKPQKIDVLKYILVAKNTEKRQPQLNPPLSPEIQELHTQSIQLLRTLLPFTDKSELVSILLSKPLKNMDSIKKVRKTLFPKRLEDSQDLQNLEKRYNIHNISQLLSEHEAVEKR